MDPRRLLTVIFLVSCFITSCQDGTTAELEHALKAETTASPARQTIQAGRLQ